MALRSYRLEERIGVGGEGEVWRVRDPYGQALALKARPRVDDATERGFHVEFERLRTLRLPSVVRVLDSGADQGYTFFTMELAEGVAFDVHVSDGATWADRCRRAVRAGAGVARALTGVHRLGLAHRDVKPANIVVSANDEVVLLDFGTLRWGGAADSSSEMMGTMAWMSPEQRIGQPHDHRADCYALGLTLYSALTGDPPTGTRAGRPRPSLARLAPEIPLALAALVDDLLRLDPTERPSAEETEARLEAIAARRVGSAPPWPDPLHTVGDASALMHGHAAVIGPPGSGRRRLVNEARWTWYRQGYRSVSGQGRPDQPFGAIRALLQDTLGALDPSVRISLVGAHARCLAPICPQLIQPDADADPWPPDPFAVAAAIASVLDQCAPLAAVIWDADDADVGSSATLAALARRVGPDVRLWVTARGSAYGLPEVRPPPWSAADSRVALATLLPDGVHPPSGLRGPALACCASGWKALANWRGESGPSLLPGRALQALSLLEEPFPWRVATRLAPDLERLVLSGHLVVVDSPTSGSPSLPIGALSDTTEHTLPGFDEGTEATAQLAGARGLTGGHLAFADHGTRRLAQALIPNLQQAHTSAAEAWTETAGLNDRALRVAWHALRAGRPDEAVLLAAIEHELERDEPTNVERWVQLRDLHCAGDDDFTTAFARLYVELELRPSTFDPALLHVLAKQARTRRQKGLAGLLVVVHDARQQDRARAIRRGGKWAKALARDLPDIASRILREVALARLRSGELADAARDCRDALALGRTAADRRAGGQDQAPLSQLEVNAATTLSAALIYSGRLREASELCADQAERCREAGLHRGRGAMLANLAVCHLQMGDRASADTAAAICRAVQHAHRDPVVNAVNATMRARIAVGAGDLAAGRPLLDEAISTGQALGLRRQLNEAWSVALDAAVQTADGTEAARALQSYGALGAQSPQDHWPAALARWLWLTGDLEGALRATESAREGHASLCVRAERSRLLLVSGRFAEARAEGERLALEADAREASELATFARLVAGAAAGQADFEFAPLVTATRESRWVHLYLGALHFDAIRRQLRGENVTPLLRQLRARSEDLDHRLYGALARAEGW